ncbi:MAG: DHHA1 domain-containing protein [Nitrososphaerales archaeon]
MEKAHTAEHILMASIKRIDLDAVAVKVVHDEKGNTLYLRIKRLDWDIITEAVKAANRIIDEGRAVKEWFFESLEDAKKAIPNLRSYDERISGRVRVIEVEGYDYSACTRKHVSNTKECGYIIVTGFSKAGEDAYQIRFEVGEKAKEYAADTIALHMKVSEALGATQKTVLSTALNLKQEAQELKRRLAELTTHLLKHLNPEDFYGTKLYAALYNGVDRKSLMDYAGELASRAKTIVLLADAQKDALVVLCRSKDLAFDCSTILKEVLQKFGGRGGGKSEYSTGSVPPEAAEQVLSILKEELKRAFSKDLSGLNSIYHRDG